MVDSKSPRQEDAMRRLVKTTLLGLVVAVTLATVPAQAGTQPYCGLSWGSLPERHRVNTYTTASVENLRAGRHECFDRIVVDLGADPQGRPASNAIGYRVRYVSSVTDIETGGTIPIAGGAVLSIQVNAPAHDDELRPTYDPDDRLNAVSVDGFRTFRQVAFMGSFEGQTQVVLGVRGRLPFRVFVLDGPGDGARLVIDIAHRW
jgi:hypothetical protein